MRRETSRVSFLMCPFCVREASSDEATQLRPRSLLLPDPKAALRPITYTRRRAELARRPMDIADAEDEDLDRVAVSAIIRTKRG
jgi:hypothetical protein